MNRKGFTLVELITTITIIGILSAVAIPMVNKYFLSTKDKTYNTYVTTLYNAARSYLEKNTIFIPTSNEEKDLEISADTLLKEGYIDELVDPSKKQEQCDYTNSKVVVHNNLGKDEIKSNPDLTYKVTLSCPKSNKTLTKEYS